MFTYIPAFLPSFLPTYLLACLPFTEPAYGPTSLPTHQPLHSYLSSPTQNLYAARARDIIREHAARGGRNNPLFLMLSLQSVHGPVDVPLDYRRQHRNIKNLARRTFHGEYLGILELECCCCRLPWMHWDAEGLVYLLFDSRGVDWEMY